MSSNLILSEGELTEWFKVANLSLVKMKVFIGSNPILSDAPSIPRGIDPKDLRGGVTKAIVPSIPRDLLMREPSQPKILLKIRIFKEHLNHNRVKLNSRDMSIFK